MSFYPTPTPVHHDDSHTMTSSQGLQAENHGLPSSGGRLFSEQELNEESVRTELAQSPLMPSPQASNPHDSILYNENQLPDQESLPGRNPPIQQAHSPSPFPSQAPSAYGDISASPTVSEEDEDKRKAAEILLKIARAAIELRTHVLTRDCSISEDELVRLESIWRRMIFELNPEQEQPPTDQSVNYETAETYREEMTPGSSDQLRRRHEDPYDSYSQSDSEADLECHTHGEQSHQQLDHHSEPSGRAPMNHSTTSYHSNAHRRQQVHGTLMHQQPTQMDTHLHSAQQPHMAATQSNTPIFQDFPEHHEHVHWHPTIQHRPRDGYDERGHSIPSFSAAMDGPDRFRNPGAVQTYGTGAVQPSVQHTQAPPTSSSRVLVLHQTYVVNRLSYRHITNEPMHDDSA